MVLRAPAIDPKILMRCTMEMHDSAVDKTGEIAQESQGSGKSTSRMSRTVLPTSCMMRPGLSAIKQRIRTRSQAWRSMACGHPSG